MIDTEEVMSDTGGANLEIILVRMEGKIDRLGDRMNIFERDQNSLRQRVHDMANELQLIVGLGLPDRIRTADVTKAYTNARLLALENIEQQRKGAAKFASILYTVLGAAGTGTVAVLLRIMGTI